MLNLTFLDKTVKSGYESRHDDALIFKVILRELYTSVTGLQHKEAGRDQVGYVRQ